mgnify:FL=1
MAFSFTADDYTFTSTTNQCITTFNDSSMVVINVDVDGTIVFPSKYIDRNGKSVSLHDWMDIFNCHSRPLVGGCGFNDFVPEYF